MYKNFHNNATFIMLNAFMLVASLGFVVKVFKTYLDIDYDVFKI